MLLAYAYINSGNGHISDLCLIPSKAGGFSTPIPVRNLIPSDSAVFFIGGDENIGQEGVIIRVTDDRTGIEVKPLRPSVLYITPHNPEKPGERTDSVIIKLEVDGQLRVYAKKNAHEEYAPWNPGPRFFAQN